MLAHSEIKQPRTFAFNSKWTTVCLILLLLAMAEFLVRGPIRAVQTATHFNDFLSPYIQAKALVKGLDPYSPQVLLQLWPPQAPHFLFLPKEVANGTLVANRGFPTAYPITAFVLVSPFTLCSWNIAYALWLTALLTFFVLMLCALVDLSGFSLRDPRAILLVACVLALAPFQTGIVTANVTLMAVEIGVIAMWTARRRNDIATDILLAVAVGLKPQIGLCFLFYYLLRRRWRIFGIALALLFGIAAAGLLRLDLTHTPWLANYLSDNRILLETGVLGNFTAINPTRFGLVNLQVAFYPVLCRVDLTNAAARAIGAILLVAWLIAFFNRKSDCELLDLSALAVISLLPVYHRFYDATLLVLPVCWALTAYRKTRRPAVLSLLLILPFLIPGGTLLETLESSGRISQALVPRWWWEVFFMAHQVWFLLFLGILLIYQMATNRSQITVATTASG
jgi:hypothetical protein